MAPDVLTGSFRGGLTGGGSSRASSLPPGSGTRRARPISECPEPMHLQKILQISYNRGQGQHAKKNVNMSTIMCTITSSQSRVGGGRCRAPQTRLIRRRSHVLSLTSVLCRTDFVSKISSLFQSVCLPPNDFTGSESRVNFSWRDLAWQLI